MIHDQEKSDSPIVAVKLANKPAQAGAESMEPRGETEENTGKNHTRRTSRTVLFVRLDFAVFSPAGICQQDREECPRMVMQFLKFSLRD
jgi:hypothetical protein